MVKLAYGDEMSASLLVLREKAGIAMVDDINPVVAVEEAGIKLRAQLLKSPPKRGLSLYQSM